MPLAYGLNFTKKTAQKPGGLNKLSKPIRKNAFADADESDDDDAPPAQAKRKGPIQDAETVESEAIGFFDESLPSTSVDKEDKDKRRKPVDIRDAKGPPSRMKDSKSSSNFYGDLTSQASAMKLAREAEEIDPSIYTYEPYHATATARKREAQKKEQEAQAAEPPKARYMDSLLAAAEVRKRDQLRAKERLLQKEREAEGDEFADKEKFVTEAYKRQQEEVAKAEEEEKKREEAERKKRRGMAGFFKGMLDAEEKKHEELEKMDITNETNEGDNVAGEKEQARKLKAAGAGASIHVNDEGEIVDKRELLTAGLNVTKTTAQKAAAQKAAEEERRRRQQMSRSGDGDNSGRGGMSSRDAQRERQTRMIEQQLEESLKRKAEDEELDRVKLGESLRKTRKTEDQVSSAKERYLARKREAAAAAAAGKKE